MALELEKTKKYLRVDGDDENELIKQFMETAASYMHGAVDDYDTTAASNSDFSRLGEIAQLSIVAELYENRNAGGQETKDYSYTVRSIITQLQNWSDGT